MLVRPTHIKSSPCPRSQLTNLSSSISFSECLLRSSNPASNSPPLPKLSSRARSSPSQTSAQNRGLSLSVRISSTWRTDQNLTFPTLARGSIVTVLDDAINVGHLTISDSEGTYYYGNYQKGCNDVHIKITNGNFWLRILLQVFSILLCYDFIAYDLVQIRRLRLYVPASFHTLNSSNLSFTLAVSEAYMIGDVEVSSLKGAMNVSLIDDALLSD